MFTRLPSVAAFHFRMIVLCSSHIPWLHCGLSGVSILLNSLLEEKNLTKKQNNDELSHHASFKI